MLQFLIGLVTGSILFLFFSSILSRGKEADRISAEYIQVEPRSKQIYEAILDGTLVEAKISGHIRRQPDGTIRLAWTRVLEIYRRYPRPPLALIDRSEAR